MAKQWELYSWQPFKKYPSKHYFWVNPEGIIIYERSVEPVGYLPCFDLSGLINNLMLQMKKLLEQYPQIEGKVKKVKHDLSQEQLERGWL